MTTRARIMVAFALAMTVGAIVVFWPEPAPRRVGVASGVATIGGAFQLTDHHGNTVTDQDLMGRPMLVAFGYTSCPDVCQMMLQNISEALDRMGNRAGEIEPLFISFDPARDTPKVMADHLGNFHPAIRGLTGTPEAIAAVAKAYHVFYRKVDGDDPENYEMAHSAHVYLMDAEGRYVSHFSHHAAPEDMAKGILAVLGN